MSQQMVPKVAHGPSTLELSRRINYHEFCTCSRLSSQKPGNEDKFSIFLRGIDTYSYLGTLVWGHASPRGVGEWIWQLELGQPSCTHGILGARNDQPCIILLPLACFTLTSRVAPAPAAYSVFLPFSSVTPEEHQPHLSLGFSHSRQTSQSLVALFYDNNSDTPQRRRRVF